MRLIRKIISLLACAVVLSSCGGGGGAPAVSNEPPVDNNSPGGGGATGSATLNWQAPMLNNDGTTLTDLTGYKVYGGDSPTPANLRLVVFLDNPGLATYVVDNLAAGTHYFAITAINTQNRESDFSNIVSVTVE